MATSINDLITRRNFLKGASLGVGVPVLGSLLAACGGAAPATPAAQDATAMPADHNMTPDAQAGGGMTADQMDAHHETGIKAFLAGKETTSKGNQVLGPKMDGDVKVFELTSSVIQWEYSKGQKVEAWAYNEQVPGPVLRVNQNDTVTIVLHNNLPRATSLVFPGQADVQADGAADPPQFDSGGALTSLAKTAAANGGSVTYSFVASQPGTYLYESGTEPSLQVQMGLFGALVVRPSMGAGYAYNRTDSQFSLNNEYIELFSEIDPILHHAVDVNIHKSPPAAISFNMVNYVPRYFLINGRGFPDTIAPNYASWLPDQPYGSLTHIQPYSSSTNPLPALVRYLNVGTTDVPFHPHGNLRGALLRHQRQVARDIGVCGACCGHRRDDRRRTKDEGRRTTDRRQPTTLLFTAKDAKSAEKLHVFKLQASAT